MSDWQVLNRSLTVSTLAPFDLFKMKIVRFFLILGANFVVTIVAYYRQCYESYSLCLITNIDDVEEQHLLKRKCKLDQSSAADWCKEKSSSLVSITNGTVQTAIEAFINDSDSKLTSDFVITSGSRYNLSSWQWISGIQLDTYPTSDYRYAYLVVSQDRADIRYDGQATSMKKFICSYLHQSIDIPDSRCSNDHQRLRRSCYRVRNETVTWYEARNLCLQEGESDLATFEGDIASAASKWWPHDEYWIGLRRESWNWPHDDPTYSYMKYSNWDNSNPWAKGDKHCLCVRVTTGKWIDCHCSQTYRYICVQAYSRSTSSSARTSTTGITTTTSKVSTTTKMPTTKTKLTTTASPKTKTTIKITTTTKKASNTLSTTMNMISTVGDPSSQFHSTQAQKLDDNLTDKASGVFLALGIGGACLLILIIVIVIVVVAVIKNRRSRSGGVGPRQQDSPPQNIYEADAPNTVYAIVVPNTSDPARSSSERTQSEIVYAELALAPTEKRTQRSSTPEITPNQIVHGPATKGSKRGRAAATESEYANSIPLESVYDNIAPS